MSVIRKIAVGVVLASYLFANTVASSFHDHSDCCSHSGDVSHHTAAGATPDVHRDAVHRAGGKHCCHHHSHGHKQAPAASQIQAPGSNSAKRTGTQKHDGGSQHNSRHCVVCDFLAIAPLAAPDVILETAGEVLPEFVVLDVVPVIGATVETHLARGPPAV